MERRTSYTIDEALIRLQKYCAYQERCHQEVRQKLWDMGMIPEAIDHIIGQLLEHNYLNEERFARAYVRGKFVMKKWGKQRLISELKRRQISKYNINQGLTEISDINYIETFTNLAEKKLQSISEQNIYRRRKKLADYLLYRGWESYLVYEKVKELIP